MDTSGKTTVTAVVDIMAPIEIIWEAWNNPEDIMQWGKITDDWQTTSVENDLRTGGHFRHEIQLNGAGGQFDYEGTYDEVVDHQLIKHTLNDNRTTTITFEPKGNAVRLTEIFEPNSSDPIEMQTKFCQVVLNSFKKHAEAKAAQ